MSGVFTALVTPFKDGEIDKPAFESLVKRQIKAGVSGLVPVGTTGEAATLTHDETDWLIETTVKLSAGKVFVLAGTGSNSTAKSIEASKRAAQLGADGCLIVTPYYNKPTQDGLVMHYSMIADAINLPIMLYSVPGRCGVEISSETASVLADSHSNIIGIKEAGGSTERISELRKACGKDFIIHSGDDGLTLSFLTYGAIGVTSVASNLYPELMVELVKSFEDGKLEKSLEIHDKLLDIFENLFIESNPIPIKTALAHKGFMSDEIRAPLTHMTLENKKILEKSMDCIS